MAGKDQGKLPGAKLDRIDLRILDVVQHDGRITKLALADQVGLSPTPCWLRLRKLERAGIILGYQARIAYRRIAPISGAMMEVTLEQHRSRDFARFETAIAALPNVASCWAVGGGIDYILKVMAPDIEAYQRFVEELLDRDLGIARYFTYVVTKTIKEDIAPPISHLIALNPADAE